MTRSQISKALDSKEGRIALAESMAGPIRKRMELIAYVRGVCPSNLRRQLEDILSNQTDAPADLHEEISLRPWDFI